MPERRLRKSPRNFRPVTPADAYQILVMAAIAFPNLLLDVAPAVNFNHAFDDV
jgi:hypothetical protein